MWCWLEEPVGAADLSQMGGFPKLGVPLRIRTIVYWGLYWGTLISGNYHIKIILKKGSRPFFTKRHGMLHLRCPRKGQRS